MNLVDLAIILVIVASTLIGWYRGFVKEVFSLASWIAAVWLAYHYALDGAVYLEPHLAQETFRVVIAFAAIFVVVLLSISLLSLILFKLIQLSGIAGIDRSLGGAFGFARGLAAVSVLLLGGYFMGFASQVWWQEALMVDWFHPINDIIKSYLPDDINQHLEMEV